MILMVHGACVNLWSAFIFNPERRVILQTELDAIVVHLFWITTKELRYILDS